jgi:hypothetical protein
MLEKKAEAEEELNVHEREIKVSQTQVLPLSSFVDYCVIDDRHLKSLYAPYNNVFAEKVLSVWLGLDHECEQMPEDLITLVDPDTSMSLIDISDDEIEKQTTENEEKIDEDEKVHDKQEQKNDEEVNEEEEEEQRRRDELDNDEDDFVPSEVIKSQTTVSSSLNKSILSKDDNGEGEWQVVQEKYYNRRRLIRHILQCPTTLTDQTVSLINDDVWQLSNDQRHDLYRYWLSKYKKYSHNSVRGARQEHNQAAALLAEYHQEEDYHILKDSVIVAMTTTCAAKYHTVLEKLRKRKNYF